MPLALNKTYQWEYKMMTPELEINPAQSNLHQVTIWGCGLMHDLTIDEIETLELQLTDIVKKLYHYRKEHENERNT